MPREVRITTPSRLMGSGPKKEANTPGAAMGPAPDSAGTCARPFSAARKPPWLFSTAPITAQMPKIMIMPWIKSLMAVAI